MDNQRWNRIIRTSDGWEIAYVPFGDRTPEEYRSSVKHSRLIAAAPELYEALDNAPLPSTLGNVQDHYQRFYDWYNNVAVPALAKARGQ